jgi:hypothetical protein
MLRRFLSIAVSCLLTTSVWAEADISSSSVLLTANIEKFYIGHQSLGDIRYGSIALDLKNESIQLTLQPQMNCPIIDGACATVMPDEIVISLPIINEVTDSCGMTTYTAVDDQTPSDGLRETIEVQDYRNAVCNYLVPTATAIIYETFNPWTQSSETSGFEAGLLK